jgi:hypothetical protein
MKIPVLLLLAWTAQQSEGALGSRLELMDTSDYLFDPIAELLFSGHLGFYRTATPPHCRIMTHSEVLRHLG